MIGRYEWDKRRVLLDGVDKFGRTQSILKITRSTLAYSESTRVMKWFEKRGFVVLKKVGRKYISRLTFKGKELLSALNKLDEVMEE